MSARPTRPLRRTQEAPPKKSRTGLIILIVVIIVILLAVGITVAIILWRRSQTTDNGGGGGGTTTCSSTSDCPSGKVCNTSSGICVTCLTDANCPTNNPACVSNNCVKCATNAQCNTDPLQPICSANNCVDCTVDSECSGNTAHSSLGENFCVNKNCVECKVDGDCTNGSCISNACCDLSIPVITAASSTIGTTDTLAGSFTYVQNTANVKYKLVVSARLSGLTASVSGTTMTVTLFDTTQFNLAVGQYVSGPNFSQVAKIVSLGTGTGSTGTYILDTSMTAASGPVEALWILYTSPSPLTPTASPQSYSITDTDFGRRLEPGSTYYHTIELTVTCGTTNSTVRSKPAGSYSGNFATGRDPIELGLNVGPDGTWPKIIANSPPNYFFEAGRVLAFLSLPNPDLSCSVSKWAGLSPALFGVVPGSSPIRNDAQLILLSLYNAIIRMPFTLTVPSGTKLYSYVKAWGSASDLGPSFWNWQFTGEALLP
jgi:hypothetical protein